MHRCGTRARTKVAKHTRGSGSGTGGNHATTTTRGDLGSKRVAVVAVVAVVAGVAVAVVLAVVVLGGGRTLGR